jgi:hypothetical protein
VSNASIRVAGCIFTLIKEMVKRLSNQSQVTLLSGGAVDGLARWPLAEQQRVRRVGMRRLVEATQEMTRCPLVGFGPSRALHPVGQHTVITVGRGW